MPSPLDGYRVLDLTDEHGLLAGQILADLGADVIQIEPRSGSSARRLGPYAGGAPDPDKSLFWWGYTRNKLVCAVDLQDPSNRAELETLIAAADFLIESFRPGELDAAGLTRARLAELNASLIHISITGFGETGPKSAYVYTDLTLMAAGGHLYLSGEPEGPPLRIQCPQAHAHGGADAAAGALVALNARHRTGRGQHVDVSLQQSVICADLAQDLGIRAGALPAARTGHILPVGDVQIMQRFAARDGWAMTAPGITAALTHFLRGLLRWAQEDGFVDQAVVDHPWGDMIPDILSGNFNGELWNRAQTGIAGLLAQYTRAELFEQALARRLLVAPVLTPGEILESDQVAAREFRVTLSGEHTGTLTYPGPFAKFSASPLSYRHPAGFAISASEASRRWTSSKVPAAEPSPGSPLEGLKVVDLFWVAAGPGATRVLADFGATVVHVESRGRPDTMRSVGPMRDGVPRAEASTGFHSYNANKLGLSLDLRTAEGKRVLEDLIRWGDVITESFAPGVMADWGFDYTRCRAINPRIIMISSCLMGQTGPWSGFAGFGTLAAAASGFHALVCDANRPPAGPFGPYTDFLAMRYNAIAILGALEHRRRTGQGQFIDLSQVEASFHFLTPVALDYIVNGRHPEPMGNASADMSPHGVYPCAGDDRWIAIAVRDTSDWRALCAQMNRHDLLTDVLTSLPGRRAAAAQIDEAVAAWTASRSPEEIEARLQAAGVPAHTVMNMQDLNDDPQLAHRGHFIDIPHPEFDTTIIQSSRFALAGEPARIPASALTYGSHNRHVLEQILGYDAATIEQLEQSNALV